ncbi:hypothetical protein [Stygiolobus caldivivus]|uniref:Uncharacterized protein n=1 Tax=Stygiolobus caldivivus TaxID=2824673 RepID=A0A8D5U4X9_9CREN|nr:hypothetical protein [Stygiolobus caldivivus]BCU69155.1 hypothetical protein KN1_04520 [Stygiolobus caldivivus]
MSIIVFFESSGNCYSLGENFTEKIDECPNYEVLVLSKVTKEVIEEAKQRKFKILECIDSEEVCIEKIRGLVFKIFKSCKFT